MSQLRIYRLDLEKYPFLNGDSQGIALFDLLGTFIIAFLLEKNTNVLNYFKITPKLYYASLIPLGVIIHWVIGQNTFLNSKLLNYNLNGIIYKVLFLCLFLYILIQ